MRVVLFLFILTLSCFQSIAQNSLVSWSYAIGSEVDYGVITKTASSNAYGDAGAVALNLLPSSEDGIAEFPVTILSKQYCVGLIPANTEIKFDIREFEFAVEITTTNSVRLLNYGALLGTFGSAKIGDKYGFEVKNREFFLLENGRPISNGYTIQSDDHLLVTSLRTQGASIEALQCDFMNVFTVGWESLVGVSALNSGQLIKTATGNSWGSASAYSTNVMNSYQDGAVFMTYDINTSEQAFGLFSDSIGAGYLDIDYCAKIRINSVDFYHKGSFIGNYMPIREDDILEVAREEDKIHFKVNGKSILNVPTDKSKILRIQGALKGNLTSAGSYETTLTDGLNGPRHHVSYIRLYNADDPEHIPYTRLPRSSIYFYIIYKEIYTENGNLNLQVFRDDNTDVTSSVFSYPSTVHFGENMIRVHTIQLQPQRQYYLVVRDGQDRKWEMNFYKK